MSLTADMRTAGLNYTDYIDSCRLVDQRFCEFVRFVDALVTMMKVTFRTDRFITAIVVLSAVLLSYPI